MKKFLKTSWCALILIALISGCNNPRNVEKEIEDKIEEFYKTSEAKEYVPISFSKLDTIFSSEVKTTGTVKHVFQARSKNGVLMGYSEVFYVNIFKDIVIVIPRSFDNK